MVDKDSKYKSYTDLELVEAAVRGEIEPGIVAIEMERRIKERYPEEIEKRKGWLRALREFEVPKGALFKLFNRDVTKLRTVIESANKEEELQQFLQRHPAILVYLAGVHGTWCIPKQKLGAEHVTDFIIGSFTSAGVYWYGIELESPKAKLFTQSGDPSSALTHAIRQVTDWRSWLKSNIDYAGRSRSQHGLGLVDINSNIECYVIIGRRKDVPESTRERRRQMSEDLRIRIHTYDWLLEAAEKMEFFWK